MPQEDVVGPLRQVFGVSEQSIVIGGSPHVISLQIDFPSRHAATTAQAVARRCSLSRSADTSTNVTNATVATFLLRVVRHDSSNEPSTVQRLDRIFDRLRCCDHFIKVRQRRHVDDVWFNCEMGPLRRLAIKP